MRHRPLAIAWAALLVLTGGSDARAQSVTVYSSLPLQGAARPQTMAVVRGAELALADAQGMAGPHPVRYVSLSDATRRAGAWTPMKTARNARRAASDDSAVGYIGEFNSGASAISMPILNEARLAQISPSNTAVGLTRDGPGSAPGEPDKYNPTGERHYFRIAPNDRVQAGALAVAMRDRGCRRVAVLTDGQLYGRGVAIVTSRRARRLGLRIVLTGTVRRSSSSQRALVRRVRRSRPGCVVDAGITANGAVSVFRRLARALPRARFFGSDGIAESGFADPRAGGVPRRVGRRVLVTVSTLAPFDYPAAGQDVLRRYGDPDPYTIYGYESMRLILDAVAAVGPSREAVIGWLAAVRDRPSVLGTYGFDAFGDTTLRTYGLYGIRDGQLVYAGKVEAP